MRRLVILAVVASAALVPDPASAQQATEQFIPIGKSPGISGVSSYSGTIQQVDAAARTISAQDQKGSRRFTITPQTRIWLDRSMRKATNLVGRFEDLKPGLKVEVKPVDRKNGETADWIKVVWN